MSKRDGIDPGERECNQVQGDEESLVEAGFRPGTSHVLARLNLWVVAITLIVSVATILLTTAIIWPDLDATRWQAWASENSGFFEALRIGDTVGVVPDRYSHAGIVITRMRDGVRVDRHLWFRFEEVPVVLVVHPRAADSWLQLDYDDSEFWPDWHALAIDPGIGFYLHLSHESASASRYDDFLARLRPSSSDDPGKAGSHGP